MRLVLTVLATASLAAVATAAGTAAPARTSALTPAEQKWATPAVAVWNNMNTRLQKVQSQLVADQALLVGTRANLALNITLANFVECSRRLGRAGKAPGRLVPVQTTMKAACARLKEGALTIAKGVGQVRKARAKAGVATIQQGLGQLQKGSAQLAKAQKQLSAISAKNPNAS